MVVQSTDQNPPERLCVDLVVVGHPDRVFDILFQLLHCRDRVTAETKWPPIQSNGKDSLKITERNFFKASKSI